MKNSKVITSLLIYLLITISNSIGQNSLQTIKEKMRFFFVDSINSSTYAPVLLDNEAISSGTETGVFWNYPGMNKSKALIRKILRPSTSGGNARMQELLAYILKIKGANARNIAYYIINDDAQNINGTNAEARFGACNVGNKAWPCALNHLREFWDRPDVPDTRWGGVIAIGEYYLRTHPDSECEGTFLHEICHTQDDSDGRTMLMFPGWTGYGADNTHFYTEAVPNMAASYKEGVANMPSYIFNENNNYGFRGYFNWFADSTSTVTVETNPIPGVDPSLYLNRTIVAAGIRPVRTWSDEIGGITYNYAEYRITSLPPKVLLHVESIVGIIGAAYAKHIGKQKLFRAISTVNPQVRQVSTSAFSQLIVEMCQQSLPAGSTIGTFSPSDASSMPYIFPLALVDYFTKYKAQNKAELFSALESHAPISDWVDMYWDYARETIRREVPNTRPNTQNDLTRIAQLLGVPNP